MSLNMSRQQLERVVQQMDVRLQVLEMLFERAERPSPSAKKATPLCTVAPGADEYGVIANLKRVFLSLNEHLKAQDLDAAKRDKQMTERLEALFGPRIVVNDALQGIILPLTERIEAMERRVRGESP